jgi:L-fuculose-phosphate aldolase
MIPRDLHEPAEAIIAAGRRLGARGLIVAGEGNLSIRLPDGTLLMTPSGLRKDELTAADLVMVDPEGRALTHAAGRRPSSDLALHVAVYAARPDVSAYAHAHLPSAMALTLAGLAPDPSELPETARFLPRLPVLPLREPGTPELAAMLAETLSEPPEPPADAALLARHGAVAVGDSLSEAVDRLELVDVLCRVWAEAILLRASSRPGDVAGPLDPPRT